MDPATINNQTIIVAANNVMIPGSINYSTPTAIFHPSGELDPQANYIVSISSGVKDEAGNPMEQPYSYFSLPVKSRIRLRRR